MAIKPNYDALRTNPQVREFLNILARSEGTANAGDDGYNINFGGTQFTSYADHPRQNHNFTQTDGKKNKTTAAGRYQFLKGTWDSVAKVVGAKDFSPANQDKAAIELIRQGGALDNILTGDFMGAINKLGHVWASLPSSPYPQPKRSMSELIGGAPVKSNEGMPQIPVQFVQQNGLPTVAIPETGEEQETMMGFEQAGYNDATQSALTAALGKITEARNSLVTQAPLFEYYPSDLDDQLLDLIDRA